MKHGCLLLLIIVFALSGCSAKQSVQPQESQSAQATPSISSGAASEPKPTASAIPKDERDLRNKQEWIQVPYSQTELEQMQQQVDDGHQPGKLDPRQVAMDFASFKLNTSGSIEEEASEDDKKIFLVQAQDNRLFRLQVLQPLQQTSTSIWVVDRYEEVEK